MCMLFYVRKCVCVCAGVCVRKRVRELQRTRENLPVFLVLWFLGLGEKNLIHIRIKILIF